MPDTAITTYQMWHLILVGVAAGITLLAVLVALFKDDVRGLWRRPVLQASIQLKAPDCHKTEMVRYDPRSGALYDKHPCYYFRIWVQNTGNLRAEQVQVYASRLSREYGDGTFREDTRFLPMNLKWAHGQQLPAGPEIFAAGISPEMGKHCDLGHIVHPRMRSQTDNTVLNVLPDKTVLELDLEVAPLTLNHLIPPGIYRLHLTLAAANCRPITKTLEIKLKGEWHDHVDRMFADGIGIKEVS